MPIGVELRRSLANKKERRPQSDIRGEEGLLHVLQHDTTRYYAKQWYKSHEKGVYMPMELEGAPLSPYWAKVKKYEADLIHGSFPEHTAHFVAAFDERITKSRTQPGEYDFHLIGGRPTTMSMEVPRDPVRGEQRDTAIAAAYGMLLPYIDAIRAQGRGVAADDPFIERWRPEVDRLMQRILGSDIHFPKLTAQIAPNASSEDITRARAKALEAAAKDVIRKNPTHVISRMVQQSVVPVHPELNFIPGNRTTHRSEPYGTFIEVTIYDPARFAQERRKALANDPDALAHFENIFARYVLNRMLDQVFDSLLTTSYGPHEQWKFTKEVETAFFRLLEAVRQGEELGILHMNPDMRSRLVRDVQSKMVCGVTPEHAAQLIHQELIQPIREAAKKARGKAVEKNK